jgi:hypothetical protein
MGLDTAAKKHSKPSAVVDTRVNYCGDNLEQLKKLPDGCIDLIYIDPPFNSLATCYVPVAPTFRSACAGLKPGATTCGKESAAPSKSGKATGELDIMDEWYPIQVKQNDKVGRPDIDKLETAMRRAGRKKGFFVGFDFSDDAMTEISGFFKRDHAVIVPLTVREILDEHIAQKLA